MQRVVCAVGVGALVSTQACGTATYRAPYYDEPYAVAHVRFLADPGPNFEATLEGDHFIPIASRYLREGARTFAVRVEPEDLEWEFSSGFPHFCTASIRMRAEDNASYLIDVELRPARVCSVTCRQIWQTLDGKDVRPAQHCEAARE